MSELEFFDGLGPGQRLVIENAGASGWIATVQDRSGRPLWLGQAPTMLGSIERLTGEIMRATTASLDVVSAALGLLSVDQRALADAMRRVKEALGRQGDANVSSIVRRLGFR
jgi:hypothetical protein